ncbi:unnamed protein product [Lota lota]
MEPSCSNGADVRVGFLQIVIWLLLSSPEIETMSSLKGQQALWPIRGDFTQSEVFRPPDGPRGGGEGGGREEGKLAQRRSSPVGKESSITQLIWNRGANWL